MKFEIINRTKTKRLFVNSSFTKFSELVHTSYSSSVDDTTWQVEDVPWVQRVQRGSVDGMRLFE